MIKLIPIRNALSNKKHRLDIVLQITVPPSDTTLTPQKNLSLVIDRSGSMSGDKIRYACEAARVAVMQLGPRDRISLIGFDDQVEVFAPSQLADHKTRLYQAIENLTARGSTALHAGWLEGGYQVSSYFQTTALNRILLISDGLANVGEQQPGRIAKDVRGLLSHGISTSTMGVGRDFDEDLLETMANAGGGYYHFIESPKTLPQIFVKELQGLSSVFGQQVRLQLEGFEGVKIIDVLNDFGRRNHLYHLPDLLSTSILEIGIRLGIPENHEGSILKATLSYQDLKQNKRKTSKTLQLPGISLAEFEKLPIDESVAVRIKLLEIARQKLEAVKALDRGDTARAAQLVDPSNYDIPTFLRYNSSITKEVNTSQKLKMLAVKDVKLARKQALAQRYERQRE